MSDRFERVQSSGSVRTGERSEERGERRDRQSRHLRCPRWTEGKTQQLFCPASQFSYNTTVTVLADQHPPRQSVTGQDDGGHRLHPFQDPPVLKPLG